MTTIAERLKTIRKLHGWTQGGVSRKAGVSDALYRQYECGDRTPKLEALTKIAQALEVPVNMLMPIDLAEPEGMLSLVYEIVESFGDVAFMEQQGRVFIGLPVDCKDGAANTTLKGIKAHLEQIPQCQQNADGSMEMSGYNINVRAGKVGTLQAVIPHSVVKAYQNRIPDLAKHLRQKRIVLDAPEILDAAKGSND